MHALPGDQEEIQGKRTTVYLIGNGQVLEWGKSGLECDRVHLDFFSFRE